MSKKDECAIFQDLYDLYMEEEIEEETMQWMKEHEETCRHCQINKGTDMEKEQIVQKDSEKIWGIRMMTFFMYSFFILLSIWMSVWYFW